MPDLRRVPSPEEHVKTPCPECFPWRPDARERYRCGKHRHPVTSEEGS